MKKDNAKAMLAARAPKALVRQIDRAAKTNRRTRSAEMLLRLEQSFAAASVAVDKA
jgi:hypothetical protein